MTDGHTRAVAALRRGLLRVPLVEEDDETLDWEMYRRCVTVCRERNVFSPMDLISRIISAQDCREKWDEWCNRMQDDVIKQREKRYLTFLGS